MLRALGADPTTTAGGRVHRDPRSHCARDAAGGRGGGGPLASLAAGSGAPGLSRVRASPRIGLVLGAGLLVLIGGLGAIAIVLAYRGAAPSCRSETPTRSSFQIQVRARRQLQPAFPLRCGRCADGARVGPGPHAVPVRSALVGTALAVALVVATVTFGSSLQTLVKHPALYGWNWSYMLSQVGSGGADVPPQALALLAHDPDVAAATGVTTTTSTSTARPSRSSWEQHTRRSAHRFSPVMPSTGQIRSCSGPRPWRSSTNAWATRSW